MVRLKDAPNEAQDFARKLVQEGRVPCDYETFLEHGVYYRANDSVGITVKCVYHEHKVKS